jgi:hypothetical protein
MPNPFDPSSYIPVPPTIPNVPIPSIPIPNNSGVPNFNGSFGGGSNSFDGSSDSFDGGSSSPGRTFQHAYIRDMVDGSKLEFQFLPTNASESKSARYIPHDIIGRSTPLLAYSNSDARVVGLTLEFFVSPFGGDSTPSLNTIKSHIDWLRSLVYPDYSNGILPPHKVMIRLGDVLAMESIVTSYSLSFPHNIWQLPGPSLPHHFAMKLDFMEVRAIPPSFDSVRSGDSSTDAGDGNVGVVYAPGGDT